MNGSDERKEAGVEAATQSRTVDGRGDPGLAKVFQEHHERVFRAAYRITGNAQDAEDVLQTVFLRLARQSPEQLDMDNPASYLYRAAINAALDVLRARRERPIRTLDEAAVPSAAEAAEVRDWLRKALAALDGRAAEVFVLRYVEELGNHDIARLLGMSRVAVGVSLYRTRRRLQEQLRRTKRGRS